MTLWKERHDNVKSECSSYGKVFLGTLEAQDSSSTSTIAGIEQPKNRNKVRTEIKVTADPHDTHMEPLTCKLDTGAEINVISKQHYDRLKPNS